MLVLSRKVDQVILIGDDIKIVVSKIKGDRVSLAIDAPRDIAVVRDDAKKGKDDAHAG